jgi:glyoxalase superfamily protein
VALRWYTTLVDCRDHRAQAHWWAEALHWKVVFESDDEAAVIPPWAEEESTRLPFERVPPGLVFVPVPEPKTGKNRLHLDLAPHVDDDRDAEIARLIDLGARRVDVGQGTDVSWTVLADREGNEFCVLSSREN